MESEFLQNKVNKVMNVVNIITTQKSFWLGVAILLIVLYHMPRVATFTTVFNPFFIGVDLFLFFSGFSLCYSYEKNRLGAFYKRRFFRIYPMFFVLAVTSSVLSICWGGICLLLIGCVI